MKLANDVRWLASGPRCGLGEIFIPENEPGSSIMPGKVNPTQCEALTMVAVQVMGNDTVMGVAASQGNFELNVYLPVMGSTTTSSPSRLLSDAMRSFNADWCLSGLTPNREKMADNLHRSLMTRHRAQPLMVGYENAAKIAKQAHAGRHLPEGGLPSAWGCLTAEDFDDGVPPGEHGLTLISRQEETVPPWTSAHASLWLCTTALPGQDRRWSPACHIQTQEDLSLAYTPGVAAALPGDSKGP